MKRFNKLLALLSTVSIILMASPVTEIIVHADGFGDGNEYACADDVVEYVTQSCDDPLCNICHLCQWGKSYIRVFIDVDYKVTRISSAYYNHDRCGNGEIAVFYLHGGAAALTQFMSMYNTNTEMYMEYIPEVEGGSINYDDGQNGGKVKFGYYPQSDEVGFSESEYNLDSVNDSLTAGLSFCDESYAYSTWNPGYAPVDHYKFFVIWTDETGKVAAYEDYAEENTGVSESTNCALYGGFMLLVMRWEVMATGWTYAKRNTFVSDFLDKYSSDSLYIEYDSTNSKISLIELNEGTYSELPLQFKMSKNSVASLHSGITYFDSSYTDSSIPEGCVYIEDASNYAVIWTDSEGLVEEVRLSGYYSTPQIFRIAKRGGNILLAYCGISDDGNRGIKDYLTFSTKLRAMNENSIMYFYLNNYTGTGVLMPHPRTVDEAIYQVTNVNTSYGSGIDYFDILLKYGNYNFGWIPVNFYNYALVYTDSNGKVKEITQYDTINSGVSTAVDSAKYGGFMLAVLRWANTSTGWTTAKRTEFLSLLSEKMESGDVYIKLNKSTKKITISYYSPIVSIGAKVDTNTTSLQFGVKYTRNISKTVGSMGMLICPEYQLGSNVLDLDFAENNSTVSNIEASAVFSEEYDPSKTYDDYTDFEYYGAITNIPQNSLNTSYVSVGYIVYEDGSVYYANPCSRSYSQTLSDSFPLDNITLNGNNLNEYVVIKPENATVSEETAVSEFCNYVYKASGIQLDVYTDATAVTSKEVCIGNTSRNPDDMCGRQRISTTLTTLGNITLNGYNCGVTTGAIARDGAYQYMEYDVGWFPLTQYQNVIWLDAKGYVKEASLNHTTTITVNAAKYGGKVVIAPRGSAVMTTLQGYILDSGELRDDVKIIVNQDTLTAIVYSATSTPIISNVPLIDGDIYTIRLVTDKLFINGGGKRGAIYGVNKFLENYLGWRFYTPDTEKCTGNGTVAVAGGLNYTYTPIFKNRDMSWIASWDPEYRAKLTLNGGAMITSYPYVAAQKYIPYGESIEFAGPLAHTHLELVQPELYFDTHPEYFAYIEGVRTPCQLCLTNSSVLDIAIDSVETWLDANPDAKIVSVSQEDALGNNFCKCSSCAAIAAAEGGYSGLYLRFANAIADAIAVEHPDVSVETLAYLFTQNAPNITVPRDNVIIRLSTFNCCFLHPVTDTTCTKNNYANATFNNDLTDWTSISDNVYIWDYTTNYWLANLYMPNWDAIYYNVQRYADAGVKGVFLQGNDFMDITGEFDKLRTYVLAKLLENPSMTYSEYYALIEEFCNSYYGDAGEYIYDYIIAFRSAVNANPNCFSCSAGAGGGDGVLNMPEVKNGTVTVDLNIATALQLGTYWKDALDAVSNNEIFLKRTMKSYCQYLFYMQQYPYSTKYSITGSSADRKNFYIGSLKLYEMINDSGAKYVMGGGRIVTKVNILDSFDCIPSNWIYYS